MKKKEVSVTAAKAIVKPIHTQLKAMPRDVGGTMPSNTMFPRLQKFASDLSPNPAERIADKPYTGPARFVGNFHDRKTPHDIMMLWKPTGDQRGNPAKKV